MSNDAAMTMLLAPAVAALVACGGPAAAPAENAPGGASSACAPAASIALARDVTVRCVAEGVWMFTALAPAGTAYAGYPANGLVVVAGERSVLVDTGWTREQARSLLAWAAGSLARPVTASLVTHFHDDRAGGASALTALGIPVFASNRTIELARERGTPFEGRPLEPESVPGLRWLYPGRGHSEDNIVVWHAPTRTLFGGCLVKALSARELGNVGDADVLGWAAAVELVARSFPDALVIVPGHGEPGGAELLTHTLALLRPPECAADEDCVLTIERLESCACCTCAPPRAMPRAAYQRARSTLLSCAPICEDAACPPCTTPAELDGLRAACQEGRCALAGR